MNKLQRLGIAVLLLVPLALQLTTACSRGIDPDELVHLHAAYSVSQGLVPYRDFFEHHGPALYYFAQPAFWIFGPTLSALWFGRILACGVSCATLAVTWFLARRLSGKAAAWISVILLSWSSVFVLKGLELRPDVPASLLIVVMVLLSVKSFPTARFMDLTGIGLIGGIATLFTQKSIIPVVSLAVSLVIARWSGGTNMDRRSRFRRAAAPLIGIGLGGFVAWAIAALAFASVGGGFSFIDSTVFQLVRWSERSERWEQLRPMIASDFILWFGGGLYVMILMTDYFRRNIEPANIVMWGTLSGCLLSLVQVKAVYPQYVLLWLPLLAISAGTWLNVINHSPSARVSSAVAGMLLLLCPLECWLLLKGLAGNQPTALPHLRAIWNQWSIPLWVALAVPVGLTVWGVLQSRSVRQPGRCVILLVAVGSCYGFFRDVDGWLWTNHAQAEKIERVNSLAGLNGTVLDGFSGYGALRPHAYYYWWLNRYSLALIPQDCEAQLLDILQHRSPDVILYDEELQSLLRLNSRIEADYQPSDLPPIWVRKHKE